MCPVGGEAVSISVAETRVGWVAAGPRGRGSALA